LSPPTPDPLFADPRLARIYDALESERADLDAYAALVDELGARSVLDVGCGTGTFACRLAAAGLDVVGVDPAAASLDVARAKPGGDAVRWVLGDASAVPPVHVDLAAMTGNVAMVFTNDDDWAATIGAIGARLRRGAWFVFETRIPERQAWLEWTSTETFERRDLPRAGPVAHWIEVIDVRLPFVTFRHSYEFASDGAVLTSDSTLRFRSRDEIERSLAQAAFTVDEIRDAPDRPGRELAFIARRD
jgi:SAM-dependent methyltransferase